MERGFWTELQYKASKMRYVLITLIWQGLTLLLVTHPADLLLPFLLLDLVLLTVNLNHK